MGTLAAAADRPAWAAVDLEAIARNVRGVKGILAPGTALCAVVKADAYGHGAVRVAEVALAAGAERLGVALPSEGVELRRAGFRCPILVLGTLFPEQAPECVSWGLAATTASPGNAKAFSEAALALGKTARLHLKVDTGMARLGCGLDEAPAFAEAIARLPGVELEGVFSHLADADAPDPSFARGQLSRFMDVLDRMRKRGVEPRLRHIANSAGTLALPESRLDMVRVGIVLYGIKPDPGFPVPFGLSPAMRLVARLASVRDLPASASVGYGRAWTARRASRVGTVPLGYADGYPRSLSNHGEVIVAGGRAPVIGRVCMDMFMIDLTDLPGAAEGDEVLVFGGPEYPAEEYAARFGSIGYEATCLVGRRVPRLYTPSNNIPI